MKGNLNALRLTEWFIGSSVFGLIHFILWFGKLDFLPEEEIFFTWLSLSLFSCLWLAICAISQSRRTLRSWVSLGVTGATIVGVVSFSFNVLMADAFRGRLYWGNPDGFGELLILVGYLLLRYLIVFGLSSGLGAAVSSWFVQERMGARSAILTK
ncbi:MAG: hypothetical protein DRP71_16780 [Verrucomicrobia bacterium]|nr:MAG: hypothetical protein DRP71_16780 [Verrucomicrobiota bacterium]